MTALTYKGAMSKGQDGYPPSALTIMQCSKSYVGGQLIGVVGDQFADHGPSPAHTDIKRKISSGASKTYFEGHLAARVDDMIADGDAIADGNAKTLVE
jgi:uncharacterized Zn-binding protein involved in type VI secretion